MQAAVAQLFFHMPGSPQLELLKVGKGPVSGQSTPTFAEVRRRGASAVLRMGSS